MCSLIQTYLLAKKRRSGWVLAIIFLVLAITYDLLISQPGYVVSGLVSLVIATRALRDWDATT